MYVNLVDYYIFETNKPETPQARRIATKNAYHTGRGMLNFSMKKEKPFWKTAQNKRKQG